MFLEQSGQVSRSHCDASGWIYGFLQPFFPLNMGGCVFGKKLTLSAFSCMGVKIDGSKRKMGLYFNTDEKGYFF